MNPVLTYSPDTSEIAKEAVINLRRGEGMTFILKDSNGTLIRCLISPLANRINACYMDEQEEELSNQVLDRFILVIHPTNNPTTFFMQKGYQIIPVENIREDFRLYLNEFLNYIWERV